MSAHSSELIDRLNIGKLDFVMLTAKLCRVKKIKPYKALEMMETGEVDLNELRELIIQDLQMIQPEPEPELEPEPDLE